MERLQRILSQRGVASRRKAEELITAGRVKIDGQVVTTLGTKADPLHAEIRVDGKLLRPQLPRYILLNKPSGYITTMKDERDRWTVMDLVQTRERVYPIGRLDRDTEGLLLFTNDGEVANRVMHPRYELDKEYHVATTIRPTEATMQRVRSGITIEDRRIVPHEFRIFRESREGIILTITLHEGKSHVVRRLMEAVGIPVKTLKRVRIGPLTLTGVPVGGWRDLTPGEISTLFEAIKLSDRQPARAVGAGQSQTGHTASRTLHFTRRPTRPKRPETPTAPPPQPPVRFSRPAQPATAQSAPAARPANTAGPSDSKSRRRKGEPPAPVPNRPRTVRTASGERKDPIERPRRAPAKHQPARGKHDEREQGRGPKPAGGAEQRTPSSRSDRRPSSGRQDNSSKPRRRSPRRDAI